MSLSYLYNNSFHYQDIPANAIIYRSGTSGFETIQQDQGILMSDGSHYSFGIPTAAELVQNYTGNSIVMTCNNKLVEVQVEGTSQNKLLRQIDGQWKVVDFSVQYIKPELYDPSSWQLWIADDDINVINIPKDSIENNWYGVKYNTELDQFDVTSPATFTNLLQEIYVPYKNSNTFANVSNHAIINKIDSSKSITSYNSDSLTLIYSTDVSMVFNETISDYLSAPSDVFQSTDIYSIMIYCGLFIENYNEYTSNASFLTIVKNDDNIYRKQDVNVFRNVQNCVKYNNNVIIPAQIIAYQSNTLLTVNHPQVYTAVYTDPQDTAIYHWYYPRNYINIYVIRKNV